MLIFVRAATSRLRVVRQLWQQAKPLVVEGLLGKPNKKLKGYAVRILDCFRLHPSSVRRPPLILLLLIHWVLKHILKRQGRNEFTNLASQIAYDGTNIAFVFLENHVRKLVSESSCDERKLEVLRAFCIGQTREMVNLFTAPKRNMSMAQQIEKVFNRLRQRYGVFGGLTNRPQIIDIRLGPRGMFNTVSPKS